MRAERMTREKRKQETTGDHPLATSLPACITTNWKTLLSKVKQKERAVMDAQAVAM